MTTATKNAKGSAKSAAKTAIKSAAQSAAAAPAPAPAPAPITDGRKMRTVRGPKGPSTRVPWSGGLAKEELARPGGTLLAMLIGRANQLGHQLGQMADELNVTYGYISQLRSGARQTQHISDAFADAAALYLDKPRMTILIASGRVRPEDVYEKPETSIQQLSAAMSYIQNDPEFGAFMPPEMVSADEKLQMFIVRLYDKARGVSLLPGYTDPAKTAAWVEKVNAERDRLRASVAEERARKAAGGGSDE